MSKALFNLLGLIFLSVTFCESQVITPPKPTANNVYPASYRAIQYTGRFDFSQFKKPRTWAPGAYIQAKFVGKYCEITVLDENLYGTNHNTISVVIDDKPPVRYKLKEKLNKIKVANNLSDGEHLITVCKDTEAGVGYIKMLNIICDGVVNMPLKTERKIEFIGNSITCGSGMDQSEVACGKGQWYDQHNAYMSYGPLVSRNLNAQYHLSAVSGIGLIHSCCNMNITMPQVFDKLNQREGTGEWKFSRYQPDVVTITLGQNDGIQDSVKFCSAYVKFLTDLKTHYPKAKLICVSSPMADAKLAGVLKNYITGVVNFMQHEGNTGVTKYFYSRSFNSGCGGHPSMEEHKLIAKELGAFIASTMGWE